MTPADILIERRVDDLIGRGCRLPRWGWNTPTSYNGASGDERILGWQKLQIACRQGWIEWPRVCSICGAAGSLTYHVEIYLRPLFAHAICRADHYRLHRRFLDPAPWVRLVERLPVLCWARRLALVEMSRDEAVEKAALTEPF